MSDLASETPARWRQSELAHALRRSPKTVVAMVVLALIIVAGLDAGWLAPYDAFDPAKANVVDARLPPGALGLYGDFYLLGTDPQGRDMVSAMMFGLRTSLIVGAGSVALAGIFGVALGLVSGYFGGVIDALVMRAADVQISFPSILIALLCNGIARTVLGPAAQDALAQPVLILAIAASYWVQYARTVRSQVLLERHKDYVQAARVTGVSHGKILFSHLLPNVLGPVLVIATINLALAIVTEATLSFLGVGVPPTQPSLGTLVRIGNEFLFSGDWWISMLPAALLVLLSMSVNLVGDWLRDWLNPKLTLT